jgi:hypothetical protein
MQGQHAYRTVPFLVYVDWTIQSYIMQSSRFYVSLIFPFLDFSAPSFKLLIYLNVLCILQFGIVPDKDETEERNIDANKQHIIIFG